MSAFLRLIAVFLLRYRNSAPAQIFTSNFSNNRRWLIYDVSVGQTSLRVFVLRKVIVSVAFVLVCMLRCAGADESFGRAGDSQSGQSLSKQMLEAHNRIRRSHGLEPLAWSESLARSAKSWADRLASEGRLYHHPNPRYGENLYLISGGEASPADVVASWNSEAKDYDYRSNSCRSRCGHYTQIVWRNSKELGCGVGQSGNIQVRVCEYNPPGNVIGERPY
jgi:hypothetical protein